MEMTSRSFPFASILQYIVLVIIGYILAGAPLLSFVIGPTPDNQKARAGTGRPSPLSLDKAAGLVIPERNLSCTEHMYKGLHVLSRDPLVVYVEGFLREDEVQHVVDVRYAASPSWVIETLSSRGCVQVIAFCPTQLSKPLSMIPRS